MNIIILNGSPRHNGNTSSVINILKEILSKNNVVESLDICQMKLSGCCACDGCKYNGGHCVSLDDSDLVIQKIVRADVVIFATPVYWWGVSSQLKMVMDKFYSQDSQFKTMRKKIGIIAIGANELDDPQYRLIHDQFSCIGEYLGWEVSFSLPFSAYEPGEILKNDKLNNLIEEAINQL